MTQPYSNIPFSIRIRGNGYAEVMVYQEVITDRSIRRDQAYLSTLKELNIDSGDYIEGVDIELRPLYFELSEIKFILPGSNQGEPYRKYNNVATHIHFYDHSEFTSPLPYDELLMAIDTARIDTLKLNKLNERHVGVAKSFYLAGKEVPSLYDEYVKSHGDLIGAWLDGAVKFVSKEIPKTTNNDEALKKALRSVGVDNNTIEKMFSPTTVGNNKLGFFDRVKVLFNGKV